MIDSTPYELIKCKEETFVFDEENCNTKVVDFSFKLEGQERKVCKKVVEKNFQLHAHNGSGYNIWQIWSILPCDKHIVDDIRNGKGKILLKLFNGYVCNDKKQSPQYLFIICGMTHLNHSLKDRVNCLYYKKFTENWNESRLPFCGYLERLEKWLDGLCWEQCLVYSFCICSI